MLIILSSFAYAMPLCNTNLNNSPCEVPPITFNVDVGNYTNLDIFFNATSRPILFRSGEYHVSNSSFTWDSASLGDNIVMDLNENSTFTNNIFIINTTAVGGNSIKALDYSFNIITNLDTTSALTLGHVYDTFVFNAYDGLIGEFSTTTLDSFPHTTGKTLVVNCTDNYFVCNKQFNFNWIDVNIDGFTPSEMDFVYFNDSLLTLDVDYNMLSQQDGGDGNVIIRFLNSSNGVYRISNQGLTYTVSTVTIYAPINLDVTLNSTGRDVLFNWSEAVSDSNTSIDYDVFLVNGLSTLELATGLNTTSYNELFFDTTPQLPYNFILQSCDTYNCTNSTRLNAVTFCLNSWSESLSTCTNSTQIKTYTDDNSCSEQYDVPLDNGTSVSCAVVLGYEETLQSERGIPRSAWIMLFLIVGSFTLALLTQNGLLFGLSGIVVMLSGFFFVPNLTVDKFSSIATILFGLFIFFIGALISFKRK